MTHRALKLGLGTVQFGIHYGISNTVGQTPPSEVTRILEFARQSDIIVIDTASSYGNAEQVLGENDLRPFHVVSKFLPATGGESIGFQLSRTLGDLRLDSLYGYLAHRPQDFLKRPEQWKQLTAIKAEGRVRKIGFSLNAPEELEQLLALNMVPDLVQVPYNYFDHRFEKFFARLKDHGCEIHTRSAFLQGLFFADAPALSDFFNPVRSIIQNLQAEYKESLSLLLLKHVHEQPLIDHVIVGTETVDQLRENIAFLGLTNSLPAFGKILPDEVLMPMHWPKKQ